MAVSLNTSTTLGHREILQTGGYYPHLHIANCLQRLHCSQGESFTSYVIKSPIHNSDALARNKMKQVYKRNQEFK
jgi:hypothetical protein